MTVPLPSTKGIAAQPLAELVKLGRQTVARVWACLLRAACRRSDISESVCPFPCQYTRHCSCARRRASLLAGLPKDWTVSALQRLCLAHVDAGLDLPVQLRVWAVIESGTLVRPDSAAWIAGTLRFFDWRRNQARRQGQGLTSLLGRTKINSRHPDKTQDTTGPSYETPH